MVNAGAMKRKLIELTIQQIKQSIMRLVEANMEIKALTYYDEEIWNRVMAYAENCSW